MSEIEITSSSTTRKSRHTKSSSGVRHGGKHTKDTHSHRNDTSHSTHEQAAHHQAKPIHHGKPTPETSHEEHSQHTHHNDGQPEDVAADESGRPRRAKVQMRRLNLNLTESLYSEVEQLALAEGRTMTEVLRIGLGLVHLAVKARKSGGQMAIIDGDNNLHRVILPH